MIQQVINRLKQNHPTEEYISAFHFEVTFLKPGEDSAFYSANFSEVSGLDFELQTEDVMNAGDNQIVYHLPKPAKNKNLILKHAFGTFSKEFFEWIDNAINNFEFKLYDVIVVLLDENHLPIKTWHFHDIYPVKVSYTDLNASKGEIIIETLELTYKYMEFGTTIYRQVKTAISKLLSKI